LRFINTLFFKTAPLLLLSRFCGVLARSSKSAGSCVFRLLNSFLLRAVEGVQKTYSPMSLLPRFCGVLARSS
jgi:hypothetical protein